MPTPNSLPHPGKDLILYINHGWYLTVDSRGYFTGTCFEGALGMILMLRNERGDEVAMKIPRLLADTARENAHICTLMEEERRITRKMFAGRQKETGLLRAEVGPGGYLETPVHLPDETASDAEGLPSESQDGNVVLTSFEKGKRPRFLSIKIDERSKQLRLLAGLDPVRPDDPLDGIVNGPDAYVRLTGAVSQSVEAKNKLDGFRRTFALTNAPATLTGKPGWKILHETIREQASEPTWYLFLPSVVYKWASGTFQEALTTEVLGSSTEAPAGIDSSSPGYRRLRWNFKDDQIRFFRQVLSGIMSLHDAGCLHGDIRPANIMHTSKHEDPEDYYLIDYGSLALNQVSPDQRRADPDGRTLPGPTVGPMRVSPFYAPERRAATERESGDRALIVSHRQKGHVICIGYQSHLMDSRQSRETVQKARAEELFARAKALNKTEEFESPADATWPAKGDRIRIRDFIFEIVGHKHDGNWQFFYCTPTFYQVFHDRLAAPAEHQYAAIAEEEGWSLWWLPISRVTELCQLGPAADLYAFGALCLYSVYYSSPDHERPLKAPSGSPSPRGPSDARFEQMLQALASPHYFQHAFVPLDKVRAKLEAFHKMRPDASANELRTVDLDGKTQAAFEAASAGKGGKGLPWRSIYQELMDLTVLVTRTVPETHSILSKLDGNMAMFLFFIHFCLCCLHRRTSTKSLSSAKPEDRILFPFCQDRLWQKSGASVANWGAAQMAADRLDAIHQMAVALAFFPHLQVALTEVPEFEPVSEYELRRQLRDLNEQHGELGAQHSALESQYDELRTRHHAFEKRYGDLAKSHGDLEAEHRELGKRHGHLQQQHTALEDAVREYVSLSSLQRFLRDSASLREKMRQQLSTPSPPPDSPA